MSDTVTSTGLSIKENMNTGVTTHSVSAAGSNVEEDGLTRRVTAWPSSMRKPLGSTEVPGAWHTMSYVRTVVVGVAGVVAVTVVGVVDG